LRKSQAGLLASAIFFGLLIAGCSPGGSGTAAAPVGDTSSQATVSVSTIKPPLVDQTSTDAEKLPLFSQARGADPDRYDFAVAKNARFVPTRDGRSFSIVWTPKDFDSAPVRPVIVTLHGHGGWAFDGFYVWQAYAEQHGYGLMALQWWFGGGEASSDYYSLAEM
jgi:hypothetical protein